MTFSILVRDPISGALGGASATGNLGVGGWVLRGDPLAGISASQGKTPSTLWGDDVLTAMREGLDAETAVAHVVGADAGRVARQLLVLDHTGAGAAFSGDGNVPATSHLVTENRVVGGNMLANASVVAACLSGFTEGEGPIARRLLRALQSGASAGGDARGMMSAAILVVSTSEPPISWRIDHSASPLTDLGRLIALGEEDGYERWRKTLPTNDWPDR